MATGKPSTWSFRPRDLEVEAVQAELARLRARDPGARITRSDALRCLILRGEAAARDPERPLSRMLRAIEGTETPLPEADTRAA